MQLSSRPTSANSSMHSVTDSMVRRSPPALAVLYMPALLTLCVGSGFGSGCCCCLQDGRDSPTREYNNMASYAAPVTTQVVSSSQVGLAPWGAGRGRDGRCFRCTLYAAGYHEGDPCGGGPCCYWAWQFAQAAMVRKGNLPSQHVQACWVDAKRMGMCSWYQQGGHGRHQQVLYA